jgi:hypothetical protein
MNSFFEKNIIHFVNVEIDPMLQYKILAFTRGMQQGVCHTAALPFTLERILRQKKNYGNSNISPCKNI